MYPYTDRFEPKKFPEIEVLRGFLSILVLVTHIDERTLPWSWGCMDIFFCISGFVITRILLANRGQPGFVPKYVARRAIRTWPMYFVAMAFCAAVVLLGSLVGSTRWERWDAHWYELLLPMLYLQNTEMYLQSDRFEYLPDFGHSWSLAIEEQYYFLWPLVLFFALRRMSVAGMVFLVAAGLTLSALSYHQGSHPWLLVTRLHGFILGGVLAWFEMKAGSSPRLTVLGRRFFRWAWVLPTLAVAPYIVESYGVRAIAPEHLVTKLLFASIINPFFSFALLGFCLLGRFVIGAESPSEVPSRGLAAVLHYLGTISYSTYLLHAPIVFAITPYLRASYGLSYLASAALGFGLSIALAHMAYHYVELRAMRLKRYFSYARLPVASDKVEPRCVPVAVSA